ncbi:helix-turn-helix transcriptional regulator [bacterium]|jgi:DNA-binding XRE family transcriptional regulator|nr:helix-turn-helix transcriptional regulator [bacterium]
MSEHTKKPRTKEQIFSNLTFNYEGESYVIENVSKEKFHNILTLYQAQDESLSAEQIIQETLASIPGDQKYKESGFFLRQLRLRDELTQKELAEKIGLKQANISAMEKGTRAIGKQLAKKLSNVFKVHYKVFL